MRTLVHCSDVHFGPPHLERVSAGLLAMIARRRPDLAVISGDLTQRAKPEQFRAARQFVDRIPVPSLVVPGNHDVPMYRVWERVFSPFGAYRAGFAVELEPIHRDDEMLVVGVNTAYNWTFKGGRITSARALQVGELLAAAPAGLLKVVVAHHPLVPPPNFDRRTVVRNARRAMDILTAAGADLILSGHLHQSYIASSEDYYPPGGSHTASSPAHATRPPQPIMALQSGTTTSSRGRGAERHRNTCNWIELDGATMRLSHLRWEPEREEFVEQSRHVYPRRRSYSYALPADEPFIPSRPGHCDMIAAGSLRGDDTDDR